jgi:hypothetical protein
MADDGYSFRLIACRELMDSHPNSLIIQQQVKALEDALPDKPGIAVSFLPYPDRDNLQDDLD